MTGPPGTKTRRPPPLIPSAPLPIGYSFGLADRWVVCVIFDPPGADEAEKAKSPDKAEKSAG